MRIIKLGLLSVFFLFAVVTIISLFIPSRVRISRATNISAAREEVLELVADLSKWSQWHPGFDTMQFSSPKYKNGRLLSAMTPKDVRIVITGIQPDQVTAEYQSGSRRLMNGWKAISHTGSDSLTIQWYMDFRLRWYPWEKFSSLLFEGIYGTRMEKGLATLKELAEK